MRIDSFPRKMPGKTMDTRKPVLYLAPMQGITTCTYRNVYARFFSGFDYAITPFIRSCRIKSSESSVLRDLFPHRNHCQWQIVPQILGKDAEKFILLAKLLHELDYGIVNWNLGCPHTKVRNKMRGAGLLSHPDRIIAFLKKVIPAIPNQLSLKVRLGNENDRELMHLLPQLNDFPLAEIIIHPRTGIQMYDGEADLSAFEEAQSLSNHVLVYNGDITSYAKYEGLHQRLSLISRWMIGRGGIINPFLVEQIKYGTSIACSNQEKMKRFEEFHNHLFAAYEKELSGPGHILDKMKELWKYWSGGFTLGNRFFLKLSRVKQVSQYYLMVKEFISSNPQFG